MLVWRGASFFVIQIPQYNSKFRIYIYKKEILRIYRMHDEILMPFEEHWTKFTQMVHQIFLAWFYASCLLPISFWLLNVYFGKLKYLIISVNSRDSLYDMFLRKGSSKFILFVARHSQVAQIVRQLLAVCGNRWVLVDTPLICKCIWAGFWANWISNSTKQGCVPYGLSSTNLARQIY